MPSKLVGLFKSLTWADYGTPKQGQAPGPNQTATAAFTQADVTHSGIFFEPVPNASPAQFQLRDDFTVTISFNTTVSFVMSWVSSRSKSEQNRLLKHEQGHYDITALIARDFFVDVMLLKLRQFPSVQAGVKEFNSLKQNSIPKIAVAEALYETETNSGANLGDQQNWDGFIQKAFTQARTGGGQSSTGVTHKVRLLDVLRNAGKKI